MPGGLQASELPEDYGWLQGGTRGGSYDPHPKGDLPGQAAKTAAAGPAPKKSRGGWFTEDLFNRQQQQDLALNPAEWVPLVVASRGVVPREA